MYTERLIRFWEVQFFRDLISYDHLWSQVNQKCFGKEPNVNRKWTETDPKVGRRWVGSGMEVGRKWAGNGLEVGWKWAGSGLEVVRNRPEINQVCPIAFHVEDALKLLFHGHFDGLPWTLIETTLYKSAGYYMYFVEKCTVQGYVIWHKCFSKVEFL